MFKRFAVTFSLILAAAACAEPSKTPKTESPPTRMNETDTARIDAAYAHIAVIMNKAQTEAAQYGETIKQLCEKYQINPTDIDAGKVQISKDGAIKRDKPSEEPKTNKPAAAPVKK